MPPSSSSSYAGGETKFAGAAASRVEAVLFLATPLNADGPAVLKNSAASAGRSLRYSPPALVDQVYPSEEVSVARTNIVLDDDLIQQAMQVSGAKTKREAVDRAVREMVARRPVYRALRKLRGKLPWEGDVDAGRRRRG